jgi:hypothetical protein
VTVVLGLRFSGGDIHVYEQALQYAHLGSRCGSLASLHVSGCCGPEHCLNCPGRKRGVLV